MFRADNTEGYTQSQLDKLNIKFVFTVVQYVYDSDVITSDEYKSIAELVQHEFDSSLAATS